MFCQDGKKMFDPKLHQQQSQIENSPLKKKRGRKPKNASSDANDENKTFLQQGPQQGTLESQQQQSMYGIGNESKLYQKICVSSNNSSRRTSDSSTLSATSDDEVFESKAAGGMVGKQHSLVLMEDSGVLNQSEMNKICKKSMKVKVSGTKSKASKKRSSKSTMGVSGITGISSA